MEPVARLLLGDPNPALSDHKLLRWGTHGSLVVDLQKRLAYDHEQKEGGGTLWLIGHRELLDLRGAGAWLDTHFPPPASNGHDPGASPITKAYPYQDADRTLLFEVCRKHPKAFVQRRPDPTKPGGWSWSTKGVKPVPYRLPELLEGIAAGRTIFVVEGERDVDTLWAAGLAATTNPGGAGKWRPVLNQYLRGADVVIIGDHDPQAKDKEGNLLWHDDGRPRLPGQDHADDVARQLAPVAKRLRLLRDFGDAWPECPWKGDTSDYLAAHTAADLEALVRDLPTYGRALVVVTGVFTVDKLDGLPVPIRVWHVRDLVPARTVTLLGGDGGVGKSTLAMQLAVATASEQAWIGSDVRQGRALYLSAEDDRDELHRRLDTIAVFYGLALERLAGLTMWSLADEDAVLVTGSPGQVLEATPRWTELQGLVAQEHPSLIVLDSLADVYGANENDRGQVRQFVRLLRSLVTPIDAAVVLLAHPSLTGLSTGSGLSGSTAWNNSVRSRLYLSSPIPEDGGASEPNLRTLTTKKSNYTRAGDELRLRWVAGAFVNDDAGMVAGLDRQIAADRADEQFLRLLAAFEAQGRVVSHNTGHAYAPALFAREPAAQGTTSKGFEAAMRRLFQAGRIRVATRGPPSRQISFITWVESSHLE